MWDWLALPGTTSRIGVQETSNDVKHTGPSSFAGAATEPSNTTDGFPYTVAAMDFVSSDLGGSEEKGHLLSAEKAWFFLDEGAVAMSRNITLTSSAPKQQVVTTLNQCLLSDDGVVLVGTTGGGSEALGEGNFTRDMQGGWIHHANTLYLLDPFHQNQTQHIILRKGPQTGR